MRGQRDRWVRFNPCPYAETFAGHIWGILVSIYGNFACPPSLQDLLHFLCVLESARCPHVPINEMAYFHHIVKMCARIRVMLSKTQQVWRHLTTKAVDSGQQRWPSLSALAGELDMGISTVYRALSYPVEIGAIVIRPAGGLRLIDPSRLLMIWAARRNLGNDIIERFLVQGSATTVERSITSQTVILGGFGALVARSGANTVADYETVLVYGDPQIQIDGSIEDTNPTRTTELIVLEPDPLLRRYGRTTPSTQAWVDLFNLPGWQASRFVYHFLPLLLTDVVTEPGLLSA